MDICGLYTLFTTGGETKAWRKKGLFRVNIALVIWIESVVVVVVVVVIVVAIVIIYISTSILTFAIYHFDLTTYLLRDIFYIFYEICQLLYSFYISICSLYIIFWYNYLQIFIYIVKDISEISMGWGKYTLEILRNFINRYSPFSSSYPLELFNCLSPPSKGYEFPRDLYPFE
jgi:hypothetical protein